MPGLRSNSSTNLARKETAIRLFPERSANGGMRPDKSGFARGASGTAGKQAGMINTVPGIRSAARAEAMPGMRNNTKAEAMSGMKNTARAEAMSGIRSAANAKNGGLSAHVNAQPKQGMTVNNAQAARQQMGNANGLRRFTVIEGGKMAAKKPALYYDYTLLWSLIFIFVIGLIIIYSSSQYIALQEKGDAMFYFKRQLVIGSAGLIGAVIVSLIDYRIYRTFLSKIAYMGTVGLLAFTLIGGLASHGKMRWLELAGSTFQPTELAKIGLIVFLAAYISENGVRMNDREHWFKVILYAMVPTALIASQNISSGIIVAMIAAIMLFVAVENYKVFMALLAAALGGVMALKPMLHSFIIKSGITERPSQYWMRRIYGWAAPEIFMDDAYQTQQAIYAIGSGGLTGHGLGDSIQKYNVIPEVHNDMIFSIVGEEFGFIGIISIIIIYLYIMYRIYRIAVNAGDLFGSMLCTGVLAHLGMQVVLNIAVVTGVIPNTGVTLPFISYGGSAVFITMLEMGLVLSVAHRIKVANG